MDLKNLTKEQKQLVILGVIVLAAIIYLSMSLLGGKGKEQKEDGEVNPEATLSELRDKIANVRLQLADKTQIREQMKRMDAELEEYSRHLPDSTDRYAWAYENILSYSSRAGVEIDTIEKLEHELTKDKSRLDRYSIRMSFFCGYNRVVKLLRLMEEDNPLLKIRSFTLKNRPDHPMEHAVEIVIAWPVVREETSNEKE